MKRLSPCLSLAMVLLVVGLSPAWAGQALTVVTYNVSQGNNAAAQVQLIKDNYPNPPHVIVFQEIYATQFNTYKNELASKYPGYSWNSAPHKAHCYTATQDKNLCTYSGTPTCTAGTEGVGIFVLSSLTIQSTETKTFWYGDGYQAARGGVRAAIGLPDGTVVNVFAVHAPVTSCARTNMLTDLKAWAAAVATPRFLAGDFNETPSGSNITSITADYDDAWVVDNGPTGGVTFPSDGRRIDYVFGSKNSSLTVTDARVLSANPDPSDHRPVVASYDIGSLPSPWVNSDIGSVGVAGSASYSSGTFTVKGSGADIWGSADSYHYVYQALAGDGTIVARVASMQNTASTAKAGIMIRQGLTAGSKHVTLSRKPDGNVELLQRANDGGTTQWLGGNIPSQWLKLTRTGTDIYAYTSADGITWTSLGSAIAFQGTAYVGLIVCAKNNTVLNTATFDGVAVTGPGETALLTEDFSGASLDTAKWSVTVLSGSQDTSIPVQQSGGTLNIGPLLEASNSHYNGISSNASFDLTSAYAYVQAAAVPTATSTTTSFTVVVDANNHYRIFAENGSIWFEKKIAGTKTRPSITFDATQHAFWRIRHDAASNAIVFETAPSSAGQPGAWSTRQTMTKELNITAVRVELKAGTFQQTTSPGTASFDNVRVARP